MTRPRRTIWAYSYRLVPPQPAERLRAVTVLLAREHQSAARRENLWEGRLVVDERTAHILVLSDTPELDHEPNQRLERALRRINAGFALTVPLAVSSSRVGSKAAPRSEKAPVRPSQKAVKKVVRTTPIAALVAPKPRKVARKK